ncbi:MAG: hypothetical protein EA350_11060, partial [Gemmatimonadales bacterium]
MPVFSPAPSLRSGAAALRTLAGGLLLGFGFVSAMDAAPTAEGAAWVLPVVSTGADAPRAGIPGAPASALAPADDAAATPGAAADPGIRFARWPHVSHGRLVFAYHGDLWIGNADGSELRRLTSHVGTDQRPRFSPDGTLVAFTSNRAGTNHVWVVPVEGGDPRQLTFHPAGDNVQYWTP